MLPGVIEPWHLVLILIIALVIFGPGKLGDIGGSLGRGIKEFKSSMTVDDTPTKAKEPTAEETAADDAAKKEVSEKAS
jgi:sec-independent protein translocase protein TatA